MDDQDNIMCKCRGKGAPEIVDPCIRELVDCLNRHGIKTFGSCCGHGGNGEILIDGLSVKPHREDIVRLVLGKKPIIVPYDINREAWVHEAPGWPDFVE